MSSSDDPGGRAARFAEGAILRELRAVRKRPGGLSPQAMAQCPVMCDMLGNSDPEVALVELTHKVMELIDSDDDVTAVEAASYSLGLCTYADINLARLEEFGAVRFLDQRQARRYSDRGLLQLAKLISTHWTTQTVPEATLILIGLDESHVGLTVQLRWQRHIHIHPPKLSLWLDGEPQPAPFAATWTDASEPDALWHEHELAEPTVVELEGEATVRMVWRGETWPTFTVVLTGDIHADMVKSQTLAAACAVTMVRCPWPCAETGVAKRRTGQEPASCNRVDVLAHPDKRSLRATVFGGNRKRRGSHKGSAALARSMVPCSSCASLPLSRLCKVPRNCS